MACACKGRRSSKFLWTSDDGTESVVYNSQIEARAKVMRAGGTYTQQN